MRTGNRLSKVLNCCLLVENSANGFARSSFQMQLFYLGVHAPLRTSRWQTNKKCLNYLMIYCSINKCLYVRVIDTIYTVQCWFCYENEVWPCISCVTSPLWQWEGLLYIYTYRHLYIYIYVQYRPYHQIIFI